MMSSADAEVKNISDATNVLAFIGELERKIILNLRVDKPLSPYDLAIKLEVLPAVIREHVQNLVARKLAVESRKNTKEMYPEIYLTSGGEKLKKLLKKQEPY